MAKLKLEMHLNDALFALSEGVPGAITVMMDSLRYGDQIDPDNGFGVWGFMLNLDQMGIYGCRIWRLYKDVCGENLAKSIAMVRSVQMGILTAEELNSAIDGKGRIDVDRTADLLKEQLPNFQVKT